MRKTIFRSSHLQKEIKGGIGKTIDLRELIRSHSDRKPMTLAKMESLGIDFVDYERTAYGLGYIVSIELENVNGRFKAAVTLNPRQDKKFVNGEEVSFCNVPISFFKNNRGLYGCHHYKECQG